MHFDAAVMWAPGAGPGGKQRSGTLVGSQSCVFWNATLCVEVASYVAQEYGGFPPMLPMLRFFRRSPPKGAKASEWALGDAAILSTSLNAIGVFHQIAVIPRPRPLRPNLPYVHRLPMTASGRFRAVSRWVAGVGKRTLFHVVASPGAARVIAAAGQ